MCIRDRFYSFVILAVGYVLNPEEIALSQSTTGLVTADAMAKAFGTSVMAKVIIVEMCIRDRCMGERHERNLVYPGKRTVRTQIFPDNPVIQRNRCR